MRSLSTQRPCAPRDIADAADRGPDQGEEGRGEEVVGGEGGRRRQAGGSERHGRGCEEGGQRRQGNARIDEQRNRINASAALALAANLRPHEAALVLVPAPYVPAPYSSTLDPLSHTAAQTLPPYPSMT